MKTINIQYYKTAIAEFIMGSFDGKLCLLDYRYRKMRDSVDSRIKKALSAEYIEQDDVLLQQARLQLSEYLSGERKSFDISLCLLGTDFQKRVWQALLKIPYGKTSSYLALSKQIGNEKAVRAVANANGANAISIIIPCHRVIGTNGQLVGYAGGLSVKKKLLDLESNLFLNSLNL